VAALRAVAGAGAGEADLFGVLSVEACAAAWTRRAAGGSAEFVPPAWIDPHAAPAADHPAHPPGL